MYIFIGGGEASYCDVSSFYGSGHQILENTYGKGSNKEKITLLRPFLKE